MAGLSIARPLNEKMAQVIQLSVEDAYQRFLEVVGEARNMTPEQVDSIAQGRVWIASQAQELGLVDKLGNKQDAIKAAAELAKLDFYEVKTIKQSLSAEEKLMQDIFGNASIRSLIGSQSTLQNALSNQASINGLVKQLTTEVEGLKDYNDPQGIYARCLVCNISQ